MNPYIEELDNSTFEKMLADKRHKELLDAVQEGVDILSRGETLNRGILTAARANEELLDKFLYKIELLAKPQNMDVFASAIKDIKKELSANMALIYEQINKKPTDWVFDIKRNATGFISQITAKPK